MRDLRDPEKLGLLLRSLVRTQEVPVLLAADELSVYHVPSSAKNPSCIEKYGRSDEVKPLFMEVQVR